MAATILEFPVQTQCDSCKRPCGEDELAECYECGTKMCGQCHICKCDLFAADLLARINELKPPSLLRRIWLTIAYRLAS